MFHGTFEHALDDKNRLMVPAKLREEIASSEGGVFYVTQGLDRCLNAYTKSGWETAAAKMQQARDGNPSARNFLRLFFSSAMKQELDAQGRLLLPDTLRARAGLRKDVVLVGVGDHIELWDKARWTRFMQGNQDKYEKFAADEALFG